MNGQCKIDFEKWLLCWLKDNVAFENETPTIEDVEHFYKFPFSFRYGVCVDFFDSVKISVEAYKKWHVNVDYYESCTNGFLGAWKNRTEARQQSIIKANDIYNERIQNKGQ